MCCSIGQLLDYFQKRNERLEPQSTNFKHLNVIKLEKEMLSDKFRSFRQSGDCNICYNRESMGYSLGMHNKGTTGIISEVKVTTPDISSKEPIPRYRSSC